MAYKRAPPPDFHAHTSITTSNWPSPGRHAPVRNRENTPAAARIADTDEMNRRELLRALSVASVLASLPPDSHADDRPRRVDTADLDDFEQLNSHLWQVFSLARAKRAIYPLVREQLNLLTSTLKRPQTEASHKRLCMLTGDLFQLAGEVFFDANRYTDAARCYCLAADASKQAEAYDLWACTLTRHAFISMYEHYLADSNWPKPCFLMRSANASRPAAARMFSPISRSWASSAATSTKYSSTVARRANCHG